MSELIRILNVVGRMDRGGIETLIMNVYRHIDRSKVQFDFLAHYGKTNADYNEEILNLGGKIYEMPVIKTAKKVYPWKLFAYIDALKKFFANHPEYHIVHGHMTNTAAIYMPIAKRYGHATTCIAHSHLAHTQKGQSKIAYWGTNLLKRNIRKYATDYFSCSESAAHWLFEQEDIDSGKVKIIRNGIDSALFEFNDNVRTRLREELNIGNKVVIGHVGRFYPPKNHEFIIDIFKKYHDGINANSILILIGDGELRRTIEKKVDDLYLTDSVIFMGVKSNVYDFLQCFDIFIMPSFYEGLPVAGIEAQAAGLPVLASSTISSEMDITGNCQFLPLELSAEKWASELNHILSGFTRKSERNKIITSGYDIQQTADFLQNFYLTKEIASKYESRDINAL